MKCGRAVALAAWGLGFVLLLSAGAPRAMAGPTCSGAHLLDESFANGARWQLCWEERHEEGIVYSEVHYTAPGGSERMVLNEVSLAQIHVPYDDNGARFHDVTDFGVGSSNLNDLSTADCPNGTLLVDGTKDVICKQIRSSGPAYDAIGHQQQDTMLELFSVSHVGAYNYIPAYRFHDDGAIEISMGATGNLQRLKLNTPSYDIYGWPLDSYGNKIGISHVHNYYFRLDFDIGGTAGDDLFERIDVTADATASTRTKTLTAFSLEGSDDVAPDSLRSWRVRDATLTNAHGHPISYELVPLESGHRDVGPSYEPFTHYDIYVTRYKSDELYASHNNIISGAPENLTEFYDPPESIAGGADLVVWYGLTFHHIPRDEDEGRMHAHWNGFRIEPRDWNDAQPLVTDFPPVLQNPGDQLSPQGDTVSLFLSASDPEMGSLGYSAFGLPPGLNIDPLTGEIAGTLDPGSGEWNVEVRADDGNSFDRELFLWTVDAGPVWTDPGPQTNAEGDPVSLQLVATNPGGPAPTYGASGLPPGLSLDAPTGLVTGMLGYDAAGSHAVVATATDDLGNSSDQPFSWTVSNVNRLPVWSDPGTQAGGEGDTISLPLSAPDPDGEPVTFSATGLPPGLSVDANSGEIHGWLSYTSSGAYSVVATADDGIDTVDQPFDWNVGEEPAPDIPALPPWAQWGLILATAFAGIALVTRKHPASRCDVSSHG